MEREGGVLLVCPCDLMDREGNKGVLDIEESDETDTAS